MSPIEVPSFGLDENVGMTSQGDSAFFSVVVVADTTSGACRGDVAFGVSAAYAPMEANIIIENNNGAANRLIEYTPHIPTEIISPSA